MNRFPARRSFLLALLLGGSVFAVFWPTLRFGLIDLDDLSYVTHNPLVMEGFAPAHVASAFTSFQQGMYAPLLWLSLGLDAALLKASPATPGGFHLANVALHAGNSVLLFLLLFSASRNPWRSFFLAALWALHPLRVESVAWVAERKDVLSGFFGLLCIGAYVLAWRRRSSGRPRLSWTIAALVAFSLGLLVKPSLVPIPGVLLLLDFWPLRRLDPSFRLMLRGLPRLIAEKIPYVALAALAAYVATAAHRTIHGLAEAPLAGRLTDVPVHYAFYLWKTIVPRHLAPLYPDLAPSFAVAGIAGLFLLAMTAGAWLARRRRPEWLVGWLFFVGFLVPAIGLVRFGVQSVADRFTYLPAMGLSIALLPVWTSDRKCPLATHILRIVLAGCLLAGYVHATRRLLPAWRSASAFINHVLQAAPDNPYGHSLLAFQYIRTQGRFAEANREFDAVLSSQVANHEMFKGKALCIAELQGPAAARDFLRQAPAFGNPYADQAYSRDGARYALALRDYDGAIRLATKALRLPSEDPAAPCFLHLLMMTAAYEKGDPALALAHARRFPSYSDKTSLEPADFLPYYLHQWIEWHRTDAYAFFRRLIQAHPDRPELLNNIAWGLATADWSPASPADVVALAQQICAAVPAPNPGALDTLAAAQANARDFPAAVQTVQAALDLLPAGSDPRTAAFRKRLLARQNLYRQNQPYREAAFSRLMAAQFGQGLPVTDRKAAP